MNKIIIHTGTEGYKYWNEILNSFNHKEDNIKTKKDMKCEYCNSPVYKYNCSAVGICYNRAYTGNCKGNTPHFHVKQQGRNELCKCGSGKKFKKCCLK